MTGRISVEAPIESSGAEIPQAVVVAQLVADGIAGGEVEDEDQAEPVCVVEEEFGSQLQWLVVVA